MKKEITKKIRIDTKGQVLTSRGLVFAPIRPYHEKLDYILRMIAKGAKVIEVLDDGSEILLNEKNFDKDNLNPAIPEDLEVVTPPTTPNPVAAETVSSQQDTRNLSRKERKRLEAEAKRAAQQSVEVDNENDCSPVDTTAPTTVEEAIEE